MSDLHSSIQNNSIHDSVSHSHLHMLRCLVCMAHADGVIDDRERAFVQRKMDNLPLTEEQKETLLGDLETAQDPADMFRQINDPRYRSQVTYFARLLAYEDGHLHPDEQELLDKLHFMTTDGLNMEEIKREVTVAVHTDMAFHDADMASQKIKHFGPFKIFDLIGGGLFGLDIFGLGIDRPNQEEIEAYNAAHEAYYNTETKLLSAIDLPADIKAIPFPKTKPGDELIIFEDGEFKYKLIHNAEYYETPISLTDGQKQAWQDAFDHREDAFKALLDSMEQ